MYESFYGLSELPFELTANPKFLYLSASQREALSTLQYGLFSAKALTLLIGEAGTGKTTLIQAALESERCRDVRCVYLNNPTLEADDFVRLLAHKFDLSPEAGESKACCSTQLEALLRERRAAGLITALVVDEAQSLSFEMLEEIRFLANIETPTVKLLPVVLSGQPELAARLEEPNLRQLKQRVTLRALLQPFELEETAAYISQPHCHRRRRARPHVQPRSGHADPRVVRRHPSNDQRDLRQRARDRHGAWTPPHRPGHRCRGVRATFSSALGKHTGGCDVRSRRSRSRRLASGDRRRGHSRNRTSPANGRPPASDGNGRFRHAWAEPSLNEPNRQSATNSRRRRREPGPPILKTEPSRPRLRYSNTSVSNACAAIKESRPQPATPVRRGAD